MIIYPNCGEIAKNEIKLYNESLRKQNFSITPILPTCKHCSVEVAISHTCNGGSIIVLNGTCGIGKSTVAELLVNKGFLAIDGDCVMQVVRHKKNIKQVAFCDMFDEIASEIDILSIFSENIVLSHVILHQQPNIITRWTGWCYRLQCLYIHVWRSILGILQHSLCSRS